MKNRSDAEAIRAYTKIYDKLTAKGLKPTFQTMENEASKALKLFLHSKDIQFQLVRPYIHRQNAAERAIQTFKNHFVTMLCSTDKKFPMHLWDRLIPHAMITLNLLRQSRLNPKLSAHAQLNGSTIMLHHSHHQERESSFTRNRIKEDHGHHMARTDGMSDRQWNTTELTEYTVQQLDMKGYVTQ
jgi:hypothetical protein